MATWGDIENCSTDKRTIYIYNIYIYIYSNIYIYTYIYIYIYIYIFDSEFSCRNILLKMTGKDSELSFY